MCNPTPPPSSATPSPPDDSALPANPAHELSPEAKELRSVLKKCSLYLVGPMGSGKSVIGRYLATLLGFRFLDTDTIIEEIAKKPVAEIFEESGEAHFRDIETAVLDQIAPFIACCVATGGGAVVRKENWGRLQTGIVIYLQSPVDLLVDRLQGETGNRPLLKDAESIRQRMEAIMDERHALYKQADVTVKCEREMAVDDIAMEAMRSLTNFIKANPPKLAKLYPGSFPKKR